MSSKKWLVTFLISVLLVFGLLAGFNIAVDPFGVFGDRLINWYSYDETMNPRIAKINYLDKHHDKYDSYVIGCSSTSSFPVDELNEYLGASFYNLIMYGADMLDVEQTADYIIRNYTVKNLVLNVYIDNGVHYDEGEDTLTNNMNVKVSGGSRLRYYSKYLFLNPSYAIAKLKALKTDTYLTQPFDVFNVETGAYDKRLRDIEPIGSLEEYYVNYPVFTSYPAAKLYMGKIKECMESVAKIRDLCAAKGINLIVVSAPVYADYIRNFDRAQVIEFYTSLAELVPYWDFTLSSVSREPRYFYDATHFRNAVGTMALGRIFGNEDIYIPKDFGVYSAETDIGAYFEAGLDSVGSDESKYTTKLPILMYHNISKDGEGSATIAEAAFEAQIAALSKAGYTAVSFDELMAYVKSGAELPDKPVLITFDDGYLSNYEIAYPILKQYGMKATIFAIGSSVGKSVYKDTEYEIIPHFDYQQAKEMSDSGIISIQSHTYDMHQWPPYEEGRARENILRFEDEDEEDYIPLLRNDIRRSIREIQEATGKPVKVLAYPNGYYDSLSQAVLWEEGIRVTLTTQQGMNTIIKGLPQSLLGLKRFAIDDGISPEKLLEMIGDK
jgi:peptidoglycan/xylan/chitin deacetylase (PgdA/CDA1 family)